ncbi:MAG: hypothetical protein PUC00_03370 [Clostridiales bacterium]|nr:hypothetical protein [Clostridiales bacterium]
MRKPDSFRSESASDKLLDVIVLLLVAFAVIVTAYPFLYVVSVSFSDGAAVARGDVYLFPKGLSLETYKMVMQYDQLWVAYGNSIFYTIVGTICNVLGEQVGGIAIHRHPGG